MLNCARCQRLVVICRRCDRGQRYCSPDCAAAQRRRRVREAGRCYQRRPLGARNNAVRQKRWRVHRATTVTHHTSPVPHRLREEPPDENVKKESGDATSKNRQPSTALPGESSPRCHFCGRPCGPYTRRGAFRAERRGGWRVSRRP
jgi:hypothetical protein